MYFRQSHSKTIVPIIHANGPSKHEPMWDNAVNTFFSEKPQVGTMSKELTLITWSIPDERTLLQNCMEHYGLEDRLIVIPIKRPFDFLDKIRMTKKFLPKIKTKYVMGLDATDVLVCGHDNCDEVLKTFKGKEAKAVFSAEIPQWPDVDTGQGITQPHGEAPFEMGKLITELKKVRDIEKVYKWLGSPFTHLCSGCWIGETEFMTKFYDDCCDILPEGYTEETLFGGDQGFITLIAGRHYPDVILDYKSEMFLNLSQTKEGTDINLVI